MQHSLQLELLKELLSQLDQGVNADAGGLEEAMASWGFGSLIAADEASYDMRLNWKLAIDAVGETYHFKGLHRNTLAQMFHGYVLVYHSFGRNHRMILCQNNIDAYHDLPEAQSRINVGEFPVYFLFPNVVLNVMTLWFCRQMA